jgi:hypothetical protein
MSNQDYIVRTVARARAEAVEYRDANDVYCFSVTYFKRRWTVYLPGTKGERYQPHELTDEETGLVLPRIERFLERQHLLGLFGVTCAVAFEREVVSAEMAERRRLIVEWYAIPDEEERRRRLAEWIAVARAKSRISRR